MSKREHLEPTQVFLPSIYDFPVLDPSLEPWTQQTIDRMSADLGPANSLNVMVRLRRFREEAYMRNAICCLLVVLFGLGLSSFGQSAPKFTSPRIVATFQRLNQTTGIPGTLLFTPQDWGTFRVTILMVGTVANGSRSGVWETEMPVTNGAGTTTTGCILSTRSRVTTTSEIPIRAKAGVPIKFRVRRMGTTEGAAYSLFIVVEQLM